MVCKNDQMSLAEKYKEEIMGSFEKAVTELIKDVKDVEKVELTYKKGIFFMNFHLSKDSHQHF